MLTKTCYVAYRGISIRRGPNARVRAIRDSVYDFANRVKGIEFATREFTFVDTAVKEKKKETD